MHIRSILHISHHLLRLEISERLRVERAGPLELHPLREADGIGLQCGGRSVGDKAGKKRRHYAQPSFLDRQDQEGQSSQSVGKTTHTRVDRLDDPVQLRRVPVHRRRHPRLVHLGPAHLLDQLVPQLVDALHRRRRGRGRAGGGEGLLRERGRASEPYRFIRQDEIKVSSGRFDSVYTIHDQPTLEKLQPEAASLRPLGSGQG